MFWQIRKRFRQFIRRRQETKDYERARKSFIRGRIWYYAIAWTIGSFTFMHFLFGGRDPDTGRAVWIEPKDLKYYGLPGYEVKAIEFDGKKIVSKKIKSAVDEND